MGSSPQSSIEGMYLVLPVPFRLIDGRLHAETQAANGLDRWAEGFEHLTVAAPVVPEEQVASLSGFVWRDLATIEHRARITVQPLPWAYSPLTFARAWKPVRSEMAANIARAKHLQFAIGGLVGDWAAVAALEAIRQHRRYAIHTDRVEHEVLRETSSKQSGLGRFRKLAIELPLMERYHRHVIERCSLGLWHGDDCYRAYSPWCKENHLIHDVHTKQSDLIDDATLAQKTDEAMRSEELRVCYTGRLDPMKAPLEWLRAIAAARDLGARLKAIWFGEGSLLDEAKAESTRLNLDGIVSFPGFVASREELLGHVRSSHALVFTHVTPESPRNLIEALVSGTPILGYDNAYAVNLLEGEGGGGLVPLHDSNALGRLIAELASDRQRLVSLIEEAARNGRRFTDASVFQHRVELIKQFA